MLNTRKKTPRQVVVLLVEDDLEDQKLAARAFAASDFSADLRIVSDGEEAMNYILHQGDFKIPTTHQNLISFCSISLCQSWMVAAC